ncbi:MAG: YdaS family helix-turn-helix protein [Candidatus Saccharimonadales bacterium]
MSTNLEQKKALFRAIKTSGGARKLAITMQNMTDTKYTGNQVATWLHRGGVPPQHVLAVEKASGISRNLLRPDIYPVGELEK